MKETREQLAFDLLIYKMLTRLAKGYDSISLDDINDVLFLAKGSVIDPEYLREMEVLK